MDFDDYFQYQSSHHFINHDDLLDDFVKEFDELADDYIFDVNTNKKLEDVLPSLPSLTDEDKYEILSVISDINTDQEHTDNEITNNNNNTNNVLNDRVKKLLRFPCKLQEAINAYNMTLLDSLIREYCAPNIVAKPSSLPEVEGILYRIYILYKL